MKERQERWSLGGEGVLASLRGSGLELPTPHGVVLRETALPGLRPPRIVLAQNPLTVAPAAYVRRLNRVATAKTKAKTAAMTVLTHVNLRRSRKVVVLSQAMAGYVQQSIPRAASRLSVCPVTLSLDVIDALRACTLVQVPSAERDRTAAIIGSVSPHKDLETAVRAVAAAADRIDVGSATIFGAMDHPNVARRLASVAGALGLDLRFAQLDRLSLLRAAAQARVVVVSSALESLGFALPEAAVVTSAVAASTVPSHVEVAARIGASPSWYPPGDVHAATSAVVNAAGRTGAPVEVEPDALASEWRAVVLAIHDGAA